MTPHDTGSAVKVQGQEVKDQGHSVTQVSTSKNAIIQARISCRRSNLVNITSEPSATRYTAFKVIRSNIEIAITPIRIDRVRSDSVQSFITSRMRSTVNV